MRVALVRHPAPSIGPGICYGRLDVGLRPPVQEQIARLASDPALRGATRVWTSPAARCRIPAEAIAQALAVPLTIDPRLQELGFGAWEGRPWEAIGRADLDRWAASPLIFAPPGGESGVELLARLQDFHAGLRQDQRDCVVVSHGGPLKVLLALLVGTQVDLLAPAPPLGSVKVVICPGLQPQPGQTTSGGIRETMPLRKHCGRSRQGTIPSSDAP